MNLKNIFSSKYIHRSEEYQNASFLQLCMTRRESKNKARKFAFKNRLNLCRNIVLPLSSFRCDNLTAKYEIFYR